MRTDTMMTIINADPDSMAAFKRARAYKAVAAFVILFGLGVITVIAPPADSEPIVSSSATNAADPSESARHDSSFGHGASIDDALTSGVDMHG